MMRRCIQRGAKGFFVHERESGRALDLCETRKQQPHAATPAQRVGLNDRISAPCRFTPVVSIFGSTVSRQTSCHTLQEVFLIKIEIYNDNVTSSQGLSCSIISSFQARTPTLPSREISLYQDILPHPSPGNLPLTNRGTVQVCCSSRGVLL